MAVLGAPMGEWQNNPEYTVCDFKTYMKAFKMFADTDEFESYYDIFYPIANQKILYSIFGVDWKMAMSLCIAHYIALLGSQEGAPVGSTLADVGASNGGSGGIMTSANIGGFAKSWDLDHSMSGSKDAIWWNSTKWGKQLYNLFMSKPVLSMVVVTSGPVIPQRNCCPPRPWLFPWMRGDC